MNETLIEAAEYIDVHGWTKNTLENKAGQVCLLGAITKVACPGPERVIAAGHLDKFLLSVKKARGLTHYNDNVIFDGAEASKLLREAAEWE
jgi:hypothetical protein